MKNLISVFAAVAAGICLTGCTGSTEYDVRHLLAFTIIGTIIVLFLGLAKYSNLVRDEISDLQAFNANAAQLQQTHKWMPLDKTAPFSLTKVQFGLWTVIISSAYIYLSLCKGDCAAGTINKTALVLMGIFAGTAVASTIMDKNEMNDNRDRHQNTPSQGFFIDILSDDNGISLHRFQNLAWTIIAITVYLYKVSLVTNGCELPELSDTLLALTGISSVTYLTLKSKENDPPAQQIPQPQTAAPAPQIPQPQTAASA
ncbi:hypothetical protein [Dyadobacter sediminis]|uniref:Uncharacterized protein n=1 Tax=Dyadobacter sediminis TaxID=1493691 RepID=A0A5R9KBV7_9BACT|nr:hypothetical protein [Dyadobacter sediminis]TLU92219.1 hypothetical protein FEM55_15880 [Dyadobacter sediminis]GGB96441.1 hypothetical protein GCM10011325_24700 [Dyadobacter sediminis]